MSRVKGRTKAALDRIGKDKEEADPEGVAAPRQVKVGTVRLVRDTLGFVLIEATGAKPPPRQVIHVVRRGQNVAELKVSPEAKTGFIVADIVSGTPKAGDLVTWTKTGSPSPVTGGAAEEAAPEPPPTIGELAPLEPLADPRNLRPVPGIETGGGTTAESLDDPESELENELRGLPPEL